MPQDPYEVLPYPSLIPSLPTLPILSLRRFLTSSLPHIVIPHFVASSLRRFLTSSFLTSSLPHFVAFSLRRFLASISSPPHALASYSLLPYFLTSLSALVLSYLPGSQPSTQERSTRLTGPRVQSSVVLGYTWVTIILKGYFTGLFYYFTGRSGRAERHGAG